MIVSRGKQKSKSKPKRTISPEHLAKMQAGRKRSAVHRSRVKALDENGLKTSSIETTNAVLLQSMMHD